MLDVCCVDDGLAPRTEVGVVACAGAAVDAVYRSMLTNEFTVYYKRSMSSLAIISADDGALGLRHQLQAADDMKLTTSPVGVEMYIVRECKSLGTTLDEEVALGPRIATAKVKHSVAFDTIRRTCARLHRMSLPAKINLIDVLANVRDATLARTYAGTHQSLGDAPCLFIPC